MAEHKTLRPDDELEFVHVALEITGPSHIGELLLGDVDWLNTDVFARYDRTLSIETPALGIRSLERVLDRLYENEGHDFGDRGTLRSPHVLAIRFADDIVVFFHQTGVDIDPIGVRLGADSFPSFPLAGWQVNDVLQFARHHHGGSVAPKQLLRALAFYIDNDAFLQD